MVPMNLANASSTTSTAMILHAVAVLSLPKQTFSPALPNFLSKPSSILAKPVYDVSDIFAPLLRSAPALLQTHHSGQSQSQPHPQPESQALLSAPLCVPPRLSSSHDLGELRPPTANGDGGQSGLGADGGCGRVPHRPLKVLLPR